MDYRDLLNSGEAALRAGRLGAAVRLLRAVNSARVPREFRLPLANLCRRSGQVTLGLRLLTPAIDPTRKRLGANATDPEKAEYAVLLQRSGVTQAALDLLSEIDVRLAPQAPLYRAFCFFNIWEYEQALPDLENYVAGVEDPYQRLLGHVNLAAAYVNTGRNEQALALLDRHHREAKTGGYERLRANCLELRAEVRIHLRDFKRAAKDLEEAARILGAARVHDQLFVRKWFAVLAGHRAGDGAPIKDFQREAIARREWESVRDADFHLLDLRFDAGLFDRLYFGTPWAGYRRRMQDVFKLAPVATHGIFGTGPCFDTETGTLDGAICLTPGERHQTIDVLTQDFYRPKPVGALFQALCAGEHFDVFTSPNRVHQIMRRTRRWLQSAGLPASISCEAGGYAIRTHGRLAWRVPRDRVCSAPTREPARFARLLALVPKDKTLTRAQIGACLGVGKTSVNDLMNWATDHGHARRQGQGRATRYRLVG
ncbi:MAG TPA: tetratricopeptide repeat protein [Bdellovibrionales bacterium]|nr:tetratricopeptide repeat protein [Bdellovibrionales bacterium]